MIRPPILIKTFGNVKIKIWLYPKEALTCLINGLRSNSNTMSKVTNIVMFQHRMYDDSGACNCNDKIEDICFKYSSTVHRQGKIFVPIKIVNCYSNSNQLFIAELRFVQETYRSRHRHANNLLCEPINDYNECLMGCSTQCVISDIGTCLPDVTDEIERTRQCYEKIIKELICNISSENCENKNKKCIDKGNNFDHCLQNDFPPEKVLSLFSEIKLNECENSEKIPNKCCNCHENKQSYKEESSRCTDCNHKPCFQRLQNPNIRTKMFKIIPTSEPSNYTSYCDDATSARSSSPDLYSSSIPRVGNLRSINCNTVPTYKTIRSYNSGSQDSDFNKDIKEIKTTLNDIITVIGANGAVDNKTNDFSDLNCQTNQPLNLESIVNTILQKVSKRNCDSDDQFGLKKSYNCNLSDLQPKYISVTENSQDKIYHFLPQQIPIMPKAQDPATVPTLDAYDNTLPNQPQSSTDNQSRMIECLNNKLTTPESQRGVTNIYYYINNDSGQMTAGPTTKKPNPVIRDQLGAIQPHTSPNSSHISIDINGQPDNEPMNVIGVQDDVSQLIAEPITKPPNKNETISITNSTLKPPPP